MKMELEKILLFTFLMLVHPLCASMTHYPSTDPVCVGPTKINDCYNEIVNGTNNEKCHCLEYFDKPLSFMGARLFCSYNSSELAVFHSARRQRLKSWLKQINPKSKFWIGYSKPKGQTIWQWEDGHIDADETIWCGYPTLHSTSDLCGAAVYDNVLEDVCLSENLECVADDKDDTVEHPFICERRVTVKNDEQYKNMSFLLPHIYPKYIEHEQPYSVIMLGLTLAVIGLIFLLIIMICYRNNTPPY